MAKTTSSYWPQLLRKAIQIGSILFIIYAALGGVWRNFKLAHNSARLVGLMEGDAWGWLYNANEKTLELFGDSFEVSISMLGTHGNATFFGLTGMDPVLVLAQVVQLEALPWALFSSLFVPIGLALVLGKVFCSYLCPMRLLFEIGQWTRAGLERLGLNVLHLTGGPRLGGWVLLGGLAATTFTGMGIWTLILPYIGLSASVYLFIVGAVMPILVFIVGFWLMVDILFAPGWYCHNICPTGWLLEQVSRLRIWRLKTKANAKGCPKACDVCIRVCPYHLSPRDETHELACDNCGKCASACPTERLTRKLALPSAAVLLLIALMTPMGAMAHHNKGLPHYGYFENYPQVPTEEYVVIDGRWEIGATIFNFQGLERKDADTPNDIKIYHYIYDLKEDRNYMGAVDFEIRLDGEVVARYLRKKVDEEATYSTRETLPESGVYELVAILPTQPVTEVVLPFEVDLGTGGINGWLLAGIGMPVLAIFLLALFGRKGRPIPKKRRGKNVEKAAVILAIFLTSSFANAPAMAANDGSATTLEHQIEHPEPGWICPVCGLHDSCPYHADLLNKYDQGPPSAAVNALPLPAKSAEAKAPVDGVCPDCGMIGCTMQHFETESGDMVMVMAGIPQWLFLLGIAGIIIVSFVGVEWLGAKTPSTWRFNLIKKPKIYKIVKNRWFQAIPQLVTAGVLVFFSYAGLFGSRVANITPVAVWTIWWAGLIFAVALVGPAFCFACPWDGFSNLMTRLRLKARVKPLNLNFTLPSWLKNVYPAIILFVVLTWLELGYGVTTNPRTTAYMGIGMTAMAIVAALLFDGKVFCRYACPVGRISGIYSNFSPVEIRARNLKVCARCATVDCLNGNENGYACPTGISLKTTQAATNCTHCTECIKSCNKNNVAINIRPFAADLDGERTGSRLDEAWLALTLLALTLFHGLSMTPTWENFDPGKMSLLKWMGLTFGTSKLVNFSIAMTIVCALPIALYGISCVIGAKWAGLKSVSPKTLFVRYSWSLLPVALFYHLAHNSMHILMEGGEVIPLLSDPLGTGADYFGTASVHIGSLIGETSLWYLQVGLILTGHIYGIIVAHRIGHKLYADKGAAVRSLMPMLFMMILISIAGLALMHLDMNMRVGRM